MSSTDLSSQVKAQYEAYPYPLRNPQDEKTRLIHTALGNLDEINFHCFAGKKNFKDARVLVAGGGTGDATIFLVHQLKPMCGQVVYLDWSAASMEVAKARASVRGLENIQWVRGSILEIPNLNLGKFDYIECGGVLHHLEDPSQGLRNLVLVLKDDGALGLMVYGKYGRTAVYQIQNLLRLIVDPNADPQSKIKEARELLTHLPATNWLVRSGSLAPDLKTIDDHELYDLYLHSQDRAYSVPELHQWIEGCGLEFIQFTKEQRHCYQPETYLPPSELLQKIKSLPQKEQQAIAELIGGNLNVHVFFASKRKNTTADIRDLNQIPFFASAEPKLFEAISKNLGKIIKVSTPLGFEIQFMPQKYTAPIFKYLDGQRSLKKIFAEIRNEMGEVADADLLQDFYPIYRLFNQLDWLLLKHEESKL